MPILPLVCFHQHSRMNLHFHGVFCAAFSSTPSRKAVCCRMAHEHYRTSRRSDAATWSAVDHHPCFALRFSGATIPGRVHARICSPPLSVSNFLFPHPVSPALFPVSRTQAKIGNRQSKMPVPRFPCPVSLFPERVIARLGAAGAGRRNGPCVGSRGDLFSATSRDKSISCVFSITSQNVPLNAFFVPLFSSTSQDIPSFPGSPLCASPFPRAKSLDCNDIHFCVILFISAQVPSFSYTSQVRTRLPAVPGPPPDVRG